MFDLLPSRRRAHQCVLLFLFLVAYIPEHEIAQPAAPLVIVVLGLFQLFRCLYRRDFANGFLVAEVFSRYYEQDIHMHSFSNGNSLDNRVRIRGGCCVLFSPSFPWMRECSCTMCASGVCVCSYLC